MIFESGTFGWKSVGMIGRVRAPLSLAASDTSGWRDLWVTTGKDAKGSGGRSFVKSVRLQYGPNGYPSTTTFAIGKSEGTPDGEVVFQSAELDLPDKARLATAGRDPTAPQKQKPAAAASAPAAK